MFTFVQSHINLLRLDFLTCYSYWSDLSIPEPKRYFGPINKILFCCLLSKPWELALNTSCAQWENYSIWKKLDNLEIHETHKLRHRKNEIIGTLSSDISRAKTRTLRAHLIARKWKWCKNKELRKHIVPNNYFSREDSTFGLGPTKKKSFDR